MLPIIASILLALGGFAIAFYIHQKKRTKANLVCPMKAHCDSVVYSQFSSFFGVSVELLGMLYYAAVAIGYAVVLIAPDLFHSPLGYGLIIATGGAFMFSTYLVFIQIFSIKQYCTWCLSSALLSTLIAVMTVLHAGETIVALLQQHQQYVLAVGWLGLALGLGVATLTHILYFRFLKDRRIDSFEAQILQLGSEIQWLAVALVVLGWTGVMAADWQLLAGSTLIWIEIFVLSVLVITSAVLDLVVMPRLLRISAQEEHTHRKGELVVGTRLAHTVGPMALVSWYALFVLLMTGAQGAERWQPLLATYLVFLVLAVGMGYLVEKLNRPS